MQRPNALHSSLLLGSVLLLCSALTPPACAEVDYVLGRQAVDWVDNICLGTSEAYASAFVSDEKQLDANVTSDEEPADANVNFNENQGTAAFSATYLYIGNTENLYNQKCATEKYIYLFDGERFFSVGDDAFSTGLFDAIGSFAYVTSMWEASKGERVNLTVQNLVDEKWEINVPLVTVQNFVIPAKAETVLEVKGGFYDGSLAGQTLLEQYTDILIHNPKDVVPDLRFGTSYSAILINEKDGSVIYYFFVVQEPTSTWCRSTESEPAPGNETEPGPGNETEPAPGNGTEPAPGNETEPAPGNGSEPAPENGSEPEFNCIVGTAFEAKYDVTVLNFNDLHCHFGDESRDCPKSDDEYARRRLLSFHPEASKARREMVRRKLRRRSRSRRLGTATSSTTNTGSAAVKVCKFTRVSCRLNGHWATCPKTVCQ